MKRFLLLCALGSIALCGSNAYSQSRDLGAQRLILDDGAGGLLTISYAGPGNGTLVLPAGGGSLTPNGTTPNSTLAWNGTAWVQNVNLLANPVTGGITVNGGINNTADGITNTGPISGATTLSVIPDATNSFTVDANQVLVTGRDVNGSELPLIISGSIAGLTYGGAGGQTRGRLIRLANPTHFYDVGIDASGYLNINHNDATTITFPAANGMVALTSDIGNGAMGGDLTGTVSNAQIAAGAIINADVNVAAAIAGTKISPDFGAQNITTTGSINSGTGYFQGGAHALSLYGVANTRVGQSGQGLTTGQYNTTLGSGAGNVLGPGTGNTYLGANAANANFAGNMNVMVGREAGYASQGSNNSFVGVYSGYWNLGANNTFLGYYSGFANTGGTQNTYVGFYSGGDPNVSNASAFGNGAMATANNQVVLGNINVTEVLTTGNINAPSATLSALSVSTTPGDKYTGVVTTDDAAGDNIETISNSLLTANSMVVVTLNTDLGATYIINAVPGAGTMNVKFSANVADGSKLTYVIINP